MGGDDLASDDEYLTGGPSVGTAIPNRGNDDSSSDGDDNDEDSSGKNEVRSSAKREKRTRDDGAGEDYTDGVPTKRRVDGGTEKSAPKRKKHGGPMQAMGERIRYESVQSQTEILSKFADVVFQPQHIARPQTGGPAGRTDSSTSNSVMDRLTNLIAKKQLKTKLQKKSPRAIVLCLSARRAVAVLKDLAPLRLRVAKLFPKQGTIEDQARQLETTDFGVAVGTPHRINELIERGSLTLGATRLVGLDTYENDKGFSVYTLPDTAPHTEKLLREYAHPECVRRKDFAIGFV
jgi:hypothetical protein